MKEIKVTFMIVDLDDSTMEIWHDKPVNGRANDYGREVYGDKRWFELTEDYIKICPFPDDVVFIICDKEFNEIARESNDLTAYPERFISLDDVIKQEWEAQSPKYPDVKRDGWNKWILSFASGKLDSTSQSNWLDFDRTVLETNILHTFKRLGRTYHFIRHKFQHTGCPAIFYEYFVSNDYQVKSGPYLGFLGYQWENIEENNNI